jgi:hypothetical protein
MHREHTKLTERFFCGTGWRFPIAMAALTRCSRLQLWPEDLTRRAAGFFELPGRHGLERATRRYRAIGAAERVWGNSHLRNDFCLLVLAKRLDLDESVIVFSENSARRAPAAPQLRRFQSPRRPTPRGGSYRPPPPTY